jgi:hypothetical protein
MTQEDKLLLLQDLCARLPYGVQCEIGGLRYGPYTFTGDDVEDLIDGRTFKPYLRPMSSMTEEERKEVNNLIKDNRPIPYGKINNKGMDNLFSSVAVTSSILIDWLNAHHFDYRGLIEKGLAIEINESNNPYKE